MKTVGVIAEFNPFHNGHGYFVREARHSCNADFCVAVMSGNFVQRGEPAVCDKYTRTRAALLSGVDAVFEIPTVYACGSAEQFAYGSVLLLASLGCIDDICFGSELPDLEIMKNIAHILVEEPEEYRVLLSDKLREGLNFPAARQAALTGYLQAKGTVSGYEGLQDFILNGGLSSPNNILGIEYCKSILRLSRSGIVCPGLKTVQRTGSLHSSGLPDTSVDASASAVRNILKKGGKDVLSGIRPFVPKASYDLIAERYGVSMPVFSDDFSSVLYSKLLDIKYKFNLSRASKPSENAVTAADYGIPTDMLNCILNNSEEPVSFTGLADAVNSKNNTLTSVNRALLSLMLDTGSVLSSLSAASAPAVPSTPAESACVVPSASATSAAGLSYARLLGFRKESSELIRMINNSASCEIINKLADARTDSPLLECDIRAARLYDQIVYQKFGTRLTDEYRKTIEII